MNGDSPRSSSGRELHSLLADVFRRAGWKVVQQPHLPDEAYRPDLVASKGAAVYVVDMKVASEARPDRLIPLFSQAVLEAAAVARHGNPSARPLAIVASSQMPESVVERLQQFAASYAPDIAFGIIDADGLRYFSDPALNELNALPQPGRRRSPVVHRSPNLFSDLNEWMLKVLLAPRIPEGLLSAPRGAYRNASEVAKAANVSVMSAFRFVSQLDDAHFLESSDGRLRVVRVEDLMLRWQAASLGVGREIPARWILRGGDDQLGDALRSYAQTDAARPQKRPARSRIRFCVGLFAAANRLGLGFVQGPIPYLYAERLDLDALRELGLSPCGPRDAADVRVRVPSKPESVFRAAIQADGVAVSDVLQVWLDVQGHPARGHEQAEEIRRRVLQPVFSEKRR
jgi:hypothetical protein